MRVPSLVLVAALALGGCARRGPSQDPEPAIGARGEARASTQATSGAREQDFGPPERWTIDGTTLAETPSLPPALAEALRAAGRSPELIQDRVVYELNGDGRLDAVVLTPVAGVAGSYELLIVLSAGEEVQVHDATEFVDEPMFAISVVPLVDGPTLVALAPRIGPCDRGPSWTFLRPTGALLERVARIAVDDYDCAEAEAEIELLRRADGRVEGVELRHGERVELHRWDGSLGSFTTAPAGGDDRSGDAGDA